MPTFSVKQGLSNRSSASILAAETEALGQQPAAPGAVEPAGDGGASDRRDGRPDVGSLLSRWSRAALGQHASERSATSRTTGSSPSAACPADIVNAIVEDTPRDSVVRRPGAAVCSRLRRATTSSGFRGPRLVTTIPPLALAADPARGGLWLGFYRGGIASFR